MKKIAAICLSLILLCSLCACQVQNRDTAEFYYPWADLEAKITQDPTCTVISSESREVTGHAYDLRYLLSSYLRGPLDAELESPFPAGCTLMDIRIDKGALTVVLDASFASLDGIEQTIACACLAKTCIDLTSVTLIRIESLATDKTNAVSITIAADDLLLKDSAIQETE